MEKKVANKVTIEEIEKKKKLPDNLKNEQNKVTIKNIGIAILVTIYFILLNMGYKNIVKSVFVVDTQVFAFLILAISIILFERAFRKGKGTLAIYGVEMFVLFTITLFVPYIYYLKPDITNIIMVILITSFDVYYVSKSAVLCAKIKSDYNATLSDVKNIVKKEKRKVDDNDDLAQEELYKPEPIKNVKAKEDMKATKKSSKQETVKENKKVEQTKTNKKSKQESEVEEKPKKSTKSKTAKEEKTEEQQVSTSKPKTTRKKKVEKEEVQSEPKKTEAKKKSAKKTSETQEVAVKNKNEKPKTTKATTTKATTKKTSTKTTSTRKTTKKEEEK